MRRKQRDFSFYKRKSSKKLKFSIVLLFICALYFIILSLYSGYIITHPKQLSVEPFNSNIVPVHSTVEFSDINNEVTLKGWYFDSNASEKTVIFSHSYMQDKMLFGQNTMSLVKFFLKEDFNILMFDYRNHGNSESATFTFGINEKNDLTGAINYSKSKGAKKIILAGYSFGATTSILTAENESLKIDGIIADTPYSNVDNYIINNLASWTNLDNFPFIKYTPKLFKKVFNLDTSKVNPIETMKNLSPTKVLLIHSRFDTITPLSDSIKLYNANPENTILWETESSGHANTFIDSQSEYLNKLSEFIDIIIQ